MGHSQLRVTERYAYTMPESLAHSMSAVDHALGNPVGTDAAHAGGEASLIHLAQHRSLPRGDHAMPREDHGAAVAADAIGDSGTAAN